MTFPDVDNFLAILKINNADAATEYRFENAVPIDHTAILQPEGSIQFINTAGEVSGGIAAPWALDANGLSVSTRYELDGDTLVQIVEHHDAAYPVLADPWFLPAVAAAVTALKLAAMTTARVAHSCQATPGCAPAVAASVRLVVKYASSLESPSRSRLPTNWSSCNPRARAGCKR